MPGVERETRRAGTRRANCATRELARRILDDRSYSAKGSYLASRSRALGARDISLGARRAEFFLNRAIAPMMCDGEGA